MKRITVSLMLTLAGCGVDHLPSSQTPQGPPASEIQLAYDTPQLLTIGQPAKIVPYLADIADSQVIIDPPLPDGLTYDTTSGIISGVPTKVTPATSYTIGINNEVAGRGHAVLVIEVNDGPLFYSTPIVAQLGVALTPVTPRGTATLTNFSVSPVLPVGVTIDVATGVISGTPTVAQPPSYYEITGNDSQLQEVFGLNLGVADSQLLSAVTVPNGSTLACAYSGAFVGSFVVEGQPQQEGLVAISFTPDGKSLARIHDFGAMTTYDSDGTAGLSAHFDGTFQFNFTSPDSVSLTGNFSGENYLAGTYTKNGIATPFLAARLGGDPSANIRYSSEIGYSETEIAVLDRTGNKATGVGYVPQISNNGIYRWNLQYPITAAFPSAASTYDWQAPFIGEEGDNTLPATGLNLRLGLEYDDALYLNLIGCQLN
jgi:Putative Ig domain